MHLYNLVYVKISRLDKKLGQSGDDIYKKMSIFYLRSSYDA